MNTANKMLIRPGALVRKTLATIRILTDAQKFWISASAYGSGAAQVRATEINRRTPIVNDAHNKKCMIE